VTPEQIESIYDDEEPSHAWEILAPVAEGGNAVAQFYLGHLCDEASPPNREAALEWYRKASDGGFLEGTHYLASFIYFGFGTAQDTEEALRLFRIAAEAGLDSSQWKLGQHLLGEPSRREEAIGWLTPAANQGHPAAIELLKGSHRARDA
jgi:TPR repeat protein